MSRNCRVQTGEFDESLTDASCDTADATIGQAAERPNIILIMSDDMGWSDLGCYGGEISTPHLDGLAAGGVRFTLFYNTARCCPTRACLLTGLYPHQAGIGHMMDERDLPGYHGDLNANTPTIAEVLRPAGYRNYQVGKWHVTRFTAPDGPSTTGRSSGDSTETTRQSPGLAVSLTRQRSSVTTP